MFRRTLIPLAALGLVLAACATAGTTSQRGAIPVPAPVAVDGQSREQLGVTTPDQAKAGPAQNGTGVLGVYFQSDKVLILTAQLQLRSSDPWSMGDRVQQIAYGLGGDVVASSQSGNGDEKAATVTIRVPNERFNDALAQIKGLGDELVTAQVNGEDRTEQYIDLNARLTAKQAEESRYLALLARADKLEDILRIDEVLSNVRAQIEQLQGQLNALRNHSTMATITTTIATSLLGPKPLETTWQPARTFQAATAALASLFRVFGDVAIWALVWIWVPALAIAILLALGRVRRPA